MCGIFGAVIANDSSLSRGNVPDYIRSLFVLSESRGKEAAGLAIAGPKSIVVYKQPLPASKFIDSGDFRALLKSELMSDATRNTTRNGDTQNLAFIGHSRLVTDGAREQHDNNQPVKFHGVVGIHNGIIVNHQSLWDKNPELKRHGEIDSEVIFALIRKHLESGIDLEQATAQTFAEIDGSASIAGFFNDRDALLLATNNGSLYFRMSRSQTNSQGVFFFSSEEFILRQFLDANHINDHIDAGQISAVGPGEGIILDIKKLKPYRFTFENSVASVSDGPIEVPAKPRSIEDRSPTSPRRSAHVRRSQFVDFEKIASRFPHRAPSLRRCSKCILPETMPFIEFDGDGVCNFCHNSRPNVVHGHEALETLVAPYRRVDKHDCLVALSGGRDSIYGLHYVKKVLGMNPVAYTYDWGMVTDLARRNCSRICGRLGIEHILVSADIGRKRDNIRKNVEAWLAKPTLGAVPLFMAGDKAYFHFLGKVGDQLGTGLSFLCENLLERSDFKVGFAGVAPEVVDDDHTYTLGLKSKAELIAFYAKTFAKNPRYLNRSLVDSAKAFAFFYIRKRTDHNLFRYVPWVEEDLVATIRNEYDFELSPDTTATWRIGDGTAAFYNYIYHTIAGLTENDTFRSNQIREGAIDRDSALALSAIENRPRFKSIAWYLDTIGIDRSLESVLEIINRAPKRYVA